MAKKDNEKEFEDLSGGASDNINEADDSFGLPDISYEPLDRTDEEKKEEPAEPASYEPETESAWPASDSDKEEETTEVPVEASTEEEEQPLMYTQRSEDDVESETESTIFGADSDSEPAAENAETGQEEEYVPGTYASKYEKKNNTSLIWAVIFVVIILAVGGWWFFFEQPRRAELEQLAATEQQAEDQRQAQLAEQQRQAEAEAEAARLAEEAAAEEAAAEEVVPEDGTIQTISSRTGRYYIVIASAIDGDLAMDYAEDLAGQGRSISIIAPYGSVKFHRVAVTDMETLGEAESVLNELRAQYEGAWVMKY